jgi:hypothetical protein
VRGWREEELEMDLRRLRSLTAVCASLAITGAASAKGDPFAAMRVRRIAPPVPVGDLILHGSDGQAIPLSAFRGKAVLLEFFLPG